MATPLYNLPAIEAPRNALLDFSGINNAIDDWRKRNDIETRKQDVRNIGQAWQNKDYDQATNLAFTSGDPQLAMHTQQMAQQQQQFAQQQRDYTEKKLAAAFQMIEGLPPEQRDAAHDRILALHPEAFQNSFKQLPEIWRNDRGMQRQFVIASALGPKDPTQQQLVQSEIAKNQSTANLNQVHARQAKYIANDPTKPLLNVETNQYAPLPPNQQDSFEAVAKKKQAENAPAEYKAAMEAHSNANDLLNTASNMRALVDQANVGKFTELRTDTQQFLRQIGMGPKNWDDQVARTQLLKGLLAPLVGQLGQKFKPLSNSDVAFVSKAAGDPTLSKDTLTHIANALEAEAKRQIMYNSAVGEQLKRGLFPDYEGIANQVRQRIPSYYESRFGQNPNSTKGIQPRAIETMQTQAPAPQPNPVNPNLQQVPTLSPEQVTNLPSGTIYRGTDGNLYRKR